MDCQIGDHQQIPVHIHKLCDKAIPFFHDHPSRYGERTVKPGGAEHTAVTLHIQLHILFIHFHLRIFLDLKSRGIAVAGHDAVSGKSGFRYGECHDGGVISGDKISAALFDLPFLFLFQLCESVCRKNLLHIFNSMKTAWAFFNKCKKLFCSLSVH